MSVTLSEMRERTRLACHTFNGSFDADKMDYAIDWAGQRFLTETRIDRTVGTKATVSGTATIDIATSLTDFLPGCLYAAPYIGATSDRLQVVSLKTIQNRREQGAASGRPELITFVTPTVAELYPTPDDAYTISLPYYRPLGAWTYGTEAPQEVTLYIPARYTADVATGAAGYLTDGMPGHPDARAKLDRFERAIKKAKGEVVMVGVHFADQAGDLNSNYSYLGGI